MHIHPVILAGGGGTRLWPLSREQYPKQFQKLIGKKSLLQETLTRVQSPIFEKPLILCQHDHRFITAEQLRETQHEIEMMILEPQPRNTAAAAIVAALYYAEKNPDALLLLLPADHTISEANLFLTSVQKAISSAQQGNIITFGITPSYAETGYGYIEKGEPVSDVLYSVSRFVEKPEAEIAATYVEQGYLWNSGIFLSTAQSLVEAAEKYAPTILQSCRAALRRGARDHDFYRLDAYSFCNAPAISLDYAIIEKAENIMVLQVPFAWSDVGTWRAIYDTMPKDVDANALHGDAMQENCTSCLIHSEGVFTAALGVENLVIVATQDAVLVTQRDKAQDLRHFVEKLKNERRKEVIEHQRVFRPWGFYDVLDAQENARVKRISLRPYARLSLQRHTQRAEHWVVVSGTARITRGHEIFDLHTHESTFIAPGMLHRIENLFDTPLEIIEIQSGAHLSEDDIVRYEDAYGRVAVAS